MKAYVHADDQAMAEQKVREALSKGHFQAEWRVVRPDGELRWMTTRAKVDFDDAGEPVRMLGVTSTLRSANSPYARCRIVNSDFANGLMQCLS